MTIINFEHKFIFVKTKKTAGTSIESFLRRYTTSADVVTYLTPRDEKWCVERGYYSGNYSESSKMELEYMNLCLNGFFDAAMLHLKSFKRLYTGHMSVIRIKELLEFQGYRWEDFYTFTIDRHPASWLLSLLLYDNDAYNLNGVCALDLDDINCRARKFISDEFFLQKLNSCLYMEGESCLVQDVLRYENLYEDLERVLTPLVGTPDLSEFPFLKKNSQHLSYHEVFDEQTNELLRFRVGQACKMLGYQL